MLFLSFIGTVSAKTKKASSAAKVVKKGLPKKHVRKVRTSVHFRRPKTLKLARKPKYVRKSIPKMPDLDPYAIIKNPLATEAATRNIEQNNTLVFLCDIRANKHHIRSALKTLYGIEASKIRTLVRPDNQKKAFVLLPKGTEALEVAGKIGYI